MNKVNPIRTLALLLLVIFLMTQITSVNADGGQDIVKLPPHPDLGIVDINTGLETAHTPLPPDLGYKYLDANYQQALNLGTSWNRWKVDWSAVEEMPGEFTWVCQVGCAPGVGEYFDYPKLAQEDEARGINSLVILAEIPQFYQLDPPGNDQLIKGLDNDSFLAASGTTDDPNQATGINDANRWAKFVHTAMEELGQYGVQHWQIMNELNIDPYWAQVDPDPNNPDGKIFGSTSYIRVLEVAAKIVQFRNSDDILVTAGHVYKWEDILDEDPLVDDSDVLNDWAEIMFEELDSGLANFQVDVIALHTYDRSKTSYDFPILTTDYFSDTDPPLSNLQGIPIWLTETGSSDCSDDTFTELDSAGRVLVKCPPVKGSQQSRSNEEQHANYMIQSMSYGFTVPEVEKFFQFHLHDFCPYGGAGDALRKPGFGLYHNWPQFGFFVGSGGTDCAVQPWEGDERLAYQGFYQASRWLRGLQGYTVGIGENDPAEHLIFPVEGGRTHVAWARNKQDVRLGILPSPQLSQGPILLVSPDGTKNVTYIELPQQKYGMDLLGATHPQPEFPDNPPQQQGQPIIGGQTTIILEHLLFDLGANPPIFEPITAQTTITFGLNLPLGISVGVIDLEIFNESGQPVYSDSEPFSNGENIWQWDGTDMSSQPVPPGVYTYEITRIAEGFSITGQVAVSEPGVLGCYFKHTGGNPPLLPPPALAYQDFRGTDILIDNGFGEIDFTYATTDPPPIPELDDNTNWGARYAAYLEVTTPGVYQFLFTGSMDDVARLFVDGILITMPDWQTGPPTSTYSEPEIYLTKGLHTVLIEYIQATGDASLTLEWQKQGDPSELVTDLWQPGPAFASACAATPDMPAEEVLWPMYMHDPAHTGYAALETVAAPPFVQGWSFSMPGYTMPTEVAPAVTEDHVYFVLNGSGVATVYALNPADGTIDWQQTVSGQADKASSPVTDGEKVYIAINNGGSGTLYALSVSTGSIVWTSSFSSLLNTNPVLSEGYIYILEYDQNAQGPSLFNINDYRVDTQLGNSDYLGGYGSPSALSTGHPLVLEEDPSIDYFFAYVRTHSQITSMNFVYFNGPGTFTDSFLFLNKTYRNNLAGNHNNQWVYNVGRLSSSPESSQTLAAIDPFLSTQDKIAWFYNYGSSTEGYLAPVLVGNTLYHIVQFNNGGSPTATLFAFDAINGTLLSQKPAPAVSGGHYTFMTIANDVIYASATSASGSVVRAIDLATGNLLWQSPETGESLIPVVVAGGQIYFHGSDPQDTLLMYKPDN